MMQAGTDTRYPVTKNLEGLFPQDANNEVRKELESLDDFYTWLA